MIITSRENKIYKLCMKLKDKKGREENSLFIIEGMRSVRDALKNGADVKFLICCDGTQFENNKNIPVYTFPKKLFYEISGTVTPQGVCAVCHTLSSSLNDCVGDGAVILLECVQDPGNIGTIIRTALASFASGVILTKGSCDLYNPKIVRSTMSAIFSIPIVTNVTGKEVCRFFKDKGYKISAGALRDNSESLFETEFSGKQVIIIGNEGNGVSDQLLNECDSLIKIPMNRDAESLNAAVAGSVMMYEYLRQNMKKF